MDASFYDGGSLRLVKAPIIPGVQVDNAAFAGQLELDGLPLSPRCGRSPGPRMGVPDTSGVYIEEREDIPGRPRFRLRAARPIRRGEAILVEESLFLSPLDAQELQALLCETCEQEAVSDYRATSSIGPTPPGSSAWFPMPMQLSLVVVQALFEDGEEDSPRVAAFRQLSGDTERWREPAYRLWGMLREEMRSLITHEAVAEVYAIVAENLHCADCGRAGVFAMGCLAEHSCAPSAFREVVTPVDCMSRPGSPCCEGRTMATPPGSPFAGNGLSSPIVGSNPPLRPQLVLRALYDMAEGDIVSLCYVPEYLPTYQRRQLLQAEFGFKCTCPRCEREPEVASAFVCPHCSSGPCSPTGPVSFEGDLYSHPLRCEACGVMLSEEPIVADFLEMERREAVTADEMKYLHPFHWKIYGMYLESLKRLDAGERLQVMEQVLAALQRLCRSEQTTHPFLGKICESAGNAQLECGDLHQAVVCFRRAQDLYAMSHKGSPDPGHGARCYLLETRVTAGRLGAVPRRLSRPTGGLIVTRSPSMPSLAEAVAEEEQ
eukprot:TRINITY_DN83709_c0_g1_i1.p1 TRINITY_DN83709_c0_g1~~TRINITY_DN83709_c0_g1_i1.p1  ORF type:complete len:546 (-),score=78.25 TRINITY_DN83709_c0_g1_i1:374-2011(-)